MFKDLFDFCVKIDVKCVNKCVLEKLVLLGVMDNLGFYRVVFMVMLFEVIVVVG